MSSFGPLPQSIVIAEVSDWRLGASVFRRKFQADPPVEPHHIVSLYRDGDGAWWPASYVHFRPWRSVILVGGGCTDGNVVRRMTAGEREAVSAAGGILFHALRFGFAAFATRCEAFFGYCGDPRAMEVDLAAGFEMTEYPRLLVHWHRPLPVERQAALMEAVHAIGPF